MLSGNVVDSNCHKEVISIFETKNNTIKITKGDSGEFNITLFNADGTQYVPIEGDKVYFTVKRKNESFCPVIMQKEGLSIVLTHEETKNLGSGKFVYSVTLERDTGEVCTVIDEGDMEIGKAVKNE